MSTSILPERVYLNNNSGQKLTLQTLVVRDLNYSTMTRGDDPIPDIFQYGQVPPGKLNGTTSGGVPADGLGGGTNPVPYTDLVLFSEPVFLAPGFSPLNPFIGLSVALTSAAQTSGSTTDVPTTSIPRLAPYYALNRPFDPVSGVTAIATNGAWFGLDTNGASQGSTYNGVYFTYFVAGCPPGTPATPWGTILPSITPGTPSAGKKSFTLSVSGGIQGSAVDFPTTSTYNLNFGAIGGGIVQPVYPVNGLTPPATVNLLANPNNPISPITGNNTRGVWIQSIWFTYNATVVNGVVVPAISYNVTHLFTGAGNATNATVPTTCLNSIGVFTIGARGASTGYPGNPDAFDIILEVPITLANTSGGVTGYTYSNRINSPTLGEKMNANSQELTGKGFYTVYLATCSPDYSTGTVTVSTVDSGSSRASVSMLSQGSSSLSIVPSSNNGTLQFPTTQAWAGNLPLGLGSNSFRTATTYGATGNDNTNNAFWPGNNPGITLNM